MNSFLKKYGLTVLAAMIVVAAVVALFVLPRGEGSGHRNGTREQVKEPTILYGINADNYQLVEGQIGAGETMSNIFDGFGLGPARIHRIEQVSRDSFDLRKVRAGNRYVAFLEPDSLARLAHFVYEKSLTDYFVITLGGGDTVKVRNGQKPVRIDRRHANAEISSSMWNAIVDNGLPPALAAELEDIYGWSIDFFGIQSGDSFEVIYDQRYVDTLPVGIGRIWGSVFKHADKTHYAIPFRQDGKIAYWDENGNSLKKQFLKAPLKYTRISSGYSNARRHPITRVVRPHQAIDYAAPSGTPVSAVADGVVSRRFWDSKGGGNTLFIKHARGYESGYLHLRGFASGIVVGARVRQGQVIGYVGTTGASTGPHLDFRVRVNGRPVNPLKIPQEPGEPVKAANKAAFEQVRARVMGELDGSLPPGEWLVQLDSL